MFLISFNIYFVFGYACFMYICLKTAIWLFGFFWDKVWLFLVKAGWQSCSWAEIRYFACCKWCIKIWSINLQQRLGEGEVNWVGTCGKSGA